MSTLRIRLFKRQFAGMVKSGKKTQTVRPVPKRMPVVNDCISLRIWTGRPYRSLQRIIGVGIITRVDRITIEEGAVWPNLRINGKRLGAYQTKAFVRADGFLNPVQFADWFKDQHGLPFTGIVIHWSLVDSPARPVCKVCGIPGCIEARGPDFHAGDAFGSKTCDYTGTPPFADASWAKDPDAMCLWCAGTGHPYGDESYGMCQCPGHGEDSASKVGFHSAPPVTTEEAKATLATMLEEFPLPKRGKKGLAQLSEVMIAGLLSRHVTKGQEAVCPSK